MNVLITGTSSGLGEALAQQFLKNDCYKVIDCHCGDPHKLLKQIRKPVSSHCGMFVHIKAVDKLAHRLFQAIILSPAKVGKHKEVKIIIAELSS